MIARTLFPRKIMDERPPLVWAGNPGAPTPQALFIPCVKSWAQEPIVDLITCGSITPYRWARGRIRYTAGDPRCPMGTAGAPPCAEGSQPAGDGHASRAKRRYRDRRPGNRTSRLPAAV